MTTKFKLIFTVSVCIIDIVLAILFFKFADNEPVSYYCNTEVSFDCLNTNNGTYLPICITNDCYDACLSRDKTYCLSPSTEYTSNYAGYTAGGIIAIILACFSGIVLGFYLRQEKCCNDRPVDNRTPLYVKIDN